MLQRPFLLRAVGRTSKTCTSSASSERLAAAALTVSSTNQSQIRHYVKSRTPEPMRLPVRKSWAKPATSTGEGRGGADKPALGEVAIPERDFWMTLLENWDVEETPERCVELTRAYCSVALSRMGSWTREIEKNYGLGPAKLHQLAVLLCNGHTPEAFMIGTHMLHVASELGHIPSTLSMVRWHVVLREQRGQAPSSNIFTLARQRFDKYIVSPASRSDPNAMTLAGMLADSSGRNDRAKHWFDLAEAAAAKAEAKSAGGAQQQQQQQPPPASLPPHDAAARPRPARWQWEATSRIGRCRIAHRQGRAQAAVDELRVVALELDNAAAYFALAQMLPPAESTAAAREEYLLKAAVSGVPHAPALLAQLYFQRADVEDAEGGKGGGETRRMAAHWAALAEASGPGEEVVAEGR